MKYEKYQNSNLDNQIDTNSHLSLYPPIEPFNSGRLKVSEIHEIYYEEAGNPNGTPIVFIHGGPGGGITPVYRQFFNPEKFRVVLFDQRGAGKSTPHAELKDNNTWALVEDIQKLKNHLKIDNWLVFGGSWGSTLSLAYAQTYPNNVNGLILRGIFLCRKKEIDWFYQFGAHSIFPDAWEHYLEPVPIKNRHDLVNYYYSMLTSEQQEVRLKAAKHWSIWEASTSFLHQDLDFIKHANEPEFALAFARIECHYFTNNAFFETDNWLIENVHKIRHIPCHIVQGRYDIVCPMMSAWELHKAWPESKLHIIPDAGHSALEPGIRSQLVHILNDI